VAAPPVTCDAPVWRYFHALTDIAKRLIAAVDGAAIGIGTTTLLHCDRMYATDRSTFALPFASLGLTPEGASTVLLPLLMGRQRAAELRLLGERISAERLARWGSSTRTLQWKGFAKRAPRVLEL
jgi:enoyl-CoA hydratase/carnithine racemase